MKTARQGAISLHAVIASRVLSLLLMTALLAGTFVLGESADQKQKAKASSLSEEQRILHVLNRLGFGARPGDLERVNAMGLEAYMNQQLHPENISDAVAEARIRDRNLSTLSMTTAELYEKFPQPGQLLRQLERKGDLPKDLADARDNRVKGAANTGPKAGESPNTGEAMSPPATTQADAPKNALNNPLAQPPNPPDNEKYREALREYYQQNGLQLPQKISAELQASRILRAVYSERQLNEVMVDFWTNHFNVFMNKGADRWLLTSYDRDTIRPNTMGKFSDLLLATAKSPAMLFYLDNFQSVSPNANQNQIRRGGGQNPLRDLIRARGGNRGANNPNRQQARRSQQGQMPNLPLPPQAQQQRRGINENYARELMELHTLGVDGGYTQKDVQEVARCLTGWTIFAPRGAAGAVNANGNPRLAEMLRDNAGKFFFNARVHDDGEKIVLGHKIPAGGGEKDGLKVLDILAHHPATGRFIATKLARRFVMDDPSPALIDRVAAAFTKSDGDIRETLKAIFFSPEFNSQEAYRAKIKRPFELAISAIRTLGADTNGNPAIHQWIARMGQPLYGFQTPNGYPDVAENWVNTGALLERLNFGLALASNRIPGTRVDLKKFVGSAETQSIDKTKILDRFLTVLVAGDVSPNTRATLLKQLNGQVMIAAAPPPRMADQEVAELMGPQLGQRQGQLRQGPQAVISDPVTKIVGLILGSPEFQRQ